MNKKCFVKLIHCGSNPQLSERTLGDAWVSSRTRGITLIFDKVTDIKTLQELCDAGKTFPCMGNGNPTYLIQNFNFGFMGLENKLKHENAEFRLSNAESKYKKWLMTELKQTKP